MQSIIFQPSLLLLLLLLLGRSMSGLAAGRVLVLVQLFWDEDVLLERQKGVMIKGVELV